MALASAVLSAVAYQLLATEPLLALALVAAAAIAAAVLPGSTSPLLIGAAAVAGAVVSALFMGLTPVALANAVVGGLAIALALVVPLGIVRAGRQRRAFIERGWALATSEARARDASTERTQQRERASIAAEMHDGLGHQLTLIAVRLARLSLDDSLPAPARAEILEVRAGAAEAAEQLGRTVQLLRDPSRGAEHELPSVEAALERARAAGIEVHATMPERWPAGVGASAAAAVTRLVEEGMANAARHAPGSAVALEVGATAELVRVTMRNDLPERSGATQRTGGFGLLGLRHRAEVLGGEVVTGETDGAFVVTMTVPTHPEPQAPTGAAAAVEEQRSQASAQRMGASRRAVLLPLAIVAAIVIVGGWYFVLATTMSVLSPEAFAAIEVGDAQSQVEPLLPPLEMLEAPRELVQEPAGSACRYYEALVSFAERADVYVVCFDDGAVIETATVPAP